MSQTPRTSSPSGPWSRARACPIWLRPSIAPPTPCPISVSRSPGLPVGARTRWLPLFDPPGMRPGSIGSGGAMTGAPSLRARACSPTPRCTRGSASPRSKRCPSVCRSSRPPPGAIPEVVGDAAVLVAPRDVPALAEALLVVSQDATTRERLMAAGTERVRLFSWQRAGEQLAAALPHAGRCPALKVRGEAVDVQTSTHAVGSTGHRVPDDAGHRRSTVG